MSNSISREGWIKLHRKFLEWEWFDDADMVRFFIYLLLKANHTDQKWQGIKVKRGQLITGYNSLSRQLGMTIKVLRNRLKKLERTGVIARQVGNRYSIITICNYDNYNSIEEGNGELMGKPRTSQGQARGNQRAVNKNENNENNVNKKRLEDYNTSCPEDFKPVVELWLEYKHERKESYKQLGIKAFVDELLKISNRNPKIAAQIVKRSMANNWAGIFEMKEYKDSRFEDGKAKGQHIGQIVHDDGITNKIRKRMED